GSTAASCPCSPNSSRSRSRSCRSRRGGSSQPPARMHLFVQACILGLLTGGVYALMASGLALGFGVMRVINVAQGALIILGAYLSYTLYGDLGLDPFVGLIVVAPAMLVLGIVLQLVFLRPLRDEEREELSLLVTWA